MKLFDMKDKLKYFTSARKSQYIFGFLALIIVLAAAIQARAKTSFGFDFQEQRMVISGPAKTVPISVSYQSIRSVTLLDSYNTGIEISGISEDGLNYGRYRNDIYGEYSLCVVPSIPVAIEIRTDSDVIVFNYESMEITAALTRSLEDFISQKQS